MTLRAELGLGRPGAAGTVFARTKEAYLKAKKQSQSDTGPARFRRDFAYATVQLIGNLINEIQTIRNEIRESAEGLAGWDGDFVALTQRYQLYKRFFELNPLSWKPAKDWDALDTTEYESQIEGPIFLWGIKECQERWAPERGAPPCEGPDLATALSLLSQIVTAEEFERDLISSFYGLFDLTLSEFFQFYGDLAKKAARAILRALGEALTPPGNGSNAIPWLVGAGVVGGGLYAIYRWRRTRKDDEHETPDTLRIATP